jgi:sporulation integral membrane protein YlbJ
VIPLSARRIPRLIIPLAVVFINISIVLFPSVSVAAAREGVKLWLEAVLPSLLPFVIGVNILMFSGFCEKLGNLLDPITRRTLKLPGAGLFALFAGFLGGYPLGAKVTSQLRRDETLTRGQAQKLIVFTSLASPLFIIGAVGAGMFGNLTLGYIILAAHYAGMIAAGLLMTLLLNIINFDRRNPRRKPAKTEPITAKDMKFGAVLTKSVTSAMETMLLIGGLLIFFRVAAAVTDAGGFLGLLTARFADKTAAEAVLTGILEMTNGAALLSKTAESSKLKTAVTAAAGIISWGGFSVYAQSLSFISKTDISAALYMLSKILHAAFAAAAAYVLFPFLIERQTLSSYFENLRFVFFAPFAVVIALIILLAVLLFNNSSRRSSP